MMLNDRLRKRYPGGFTFTELLIVMVILSAMVSVTLPYATRSNQEAQLEQELANLQTAIQALIEYTKATQRPSRLVIHAIEHRYRLEQAAHDSTSQFERFHFAQAHEHYLPRRCYFDDLEGFEEESHYFYLLFDPSQPWPQANLTIHGPQFSWHLYIQGQRIEYEHD